MDTYIFDNEIGVDIEQLDDLTDKILTQTEEKLGVKLPVSYVELMRKQNGGTLAYKELHSGEIPDGEMYVDSIMGIDIDDGIGKSIYLTEEWDIEKGFVLFAGDGHEWLGFDYREYDGDCPSIYYIPTDDGKPMQVAKDFESLLKALKKTDFDTDDDDYEEDNYEEDDELDRVYTREELQQYIEEGSSHFDISAGLEQFAKAEGDMDWFIKQSLKTIKIIGIEDISWTVGEVVLMKLKVESKENWPIPSLQKIVDHLMVAEDEYGCLDEIAQRLGKRIQTKLLAE